jgi:hypothetical protein
MTTLDRKKRFFMVAAALVIGLIAVPEARAGDPRPASLNFVPVRQN